VSIMVRLKLTRRRVAALAFLAAILACLPDYLAAYTVSGPSEAPTLLLGDRVIVNRAAYDLKAPYSTIGLAKVGTPQRSDLISFLVPNRNMLGLKRVVGIPGDTVELRENRLTINGRPMEYAILARADFDWVPKTHGLGTVVAAEEGIGDRGHRITYTPGRSPLRTFGPMTVPDDCFFVLGDHRDNSNDSRTFGPIGRTLITGKVVWLMPANRP
jgi:signal peptidase I